MKTRTVLLVAGMLLGGVLLIGAQAAPQADSGYKLIEEGLASWYGTEFAGRPTANGEVFNPTLFTAAHNHLPFNTLVRVQNLSNGMAVVVRINDRGPYKPGRILDLSQAAAESIGLTLAGVSRVRIETVPASAAGVTTVTTTTVTSTPGPVASPPVAAPVTVPVQTSPVVQGPVATGPMVNPRGVGTPVNTDSNPPGVGVVAAPMTQPLAAETGVRTIQLVSYSSFLSAEAQAQSLVQRGFNAMVEDSGTGRYRVIVPGVPLATLQTTLADLKSVGFDNVLVRLK